MYSVDIDVGGTLTDGIFGDGQRRVCAKVDTTAHDLTVCLFDCLIQGANQLGFSELAIFLEQVELLRWSTTITSNVLAERRGPKIGLIVSKGHERDLYCDQAPSPALNRLIEESNIVAIGDVGGSEILAAVRSLLENGVRRICISLQGALENPRPELEIKRTIQEQYPDHFLGSVPALAGSDICQNQDDMTRTHYALINAYTHSALAATLFKAEDELRYSYGYSRPFLISHINGGVAGIAKTRAIDTMESGPILGLYGTGYLAKLYDLEHVIALDVGGTTAKVGMIQNGQLRYAPSSDLFGIPLRASLPYLRSIALGGGSVATVIDGCLQLGPDSMGSLPGPACYALGGDRPTLTDAFVTTGLIDPEYFLAGSKRLDVRAAYQAIERELGPEFHGSVEGASQAIIAQAFDMVARMIEKAASELGQDLSTCVLFAYGGNGGLFACSVAERVGLEDVYVFALGPVFSAFGSSVSDISHLYERASLLSLGDDTRLNELNELAEEMSSIARRDLLGEGFDWKEAEYSLEFEISKMGKANRTVRSSKLRFRNMEELLGEVGPAVWAERPKLELVRLRVRKAIARPAFLPSTPQSNFAVASSGKRKLHYGGSRVEAGIYRWESLVPGTQLEECAILESVNSTYFLPPGWKLKIDQYGNGQMSRANAQSQHVVAKNLREVQTHGKSK